MKIIVPFCRLSNTIHQVFDMATCKRSEFQVNRLKEISERPDFAYFAIMQDVDGDFIVHPAYACPFFNTWYDVNGDFHAERIGRRAVLFSKDYKGNGDLPITHPVYQSRIIK